VKLESLPVIESTDEPHKIKGKMKFIEKRSAGFLLGSMMTILSLQSTAQTIVTESFDGTFPPAGWTGGTGGPGALWVQRTNGTNPACTPHSGTAMARYSSFSAPPGTQDEFISPAFDLSGSAGFTPTFSLWVYRDGNSTAGDSLTIYVNNSTSLTGAVRIGGVARSRFFVLPVNEPADGWYQYTFNIPGSFNTATNHIILQGTARGGGNIYIDDVEWVAYPPVCGGTPTAGTLAANPASICGGPGNSNLSLTGASSGASGITYQWQTGPSDTGPWTDFGTSATTVNTGILSADAWFRCIVTCGPSALSDSTSAVLVTVNPNPAPVVAVTPNQNVFYCSGSAPILLVASGASTYAWTPNIAIPNGVGDSAWASPTVNTTYIIVGSDSSGCADTATVNVQVRTTPNVVATTNNDTICSGQSTNLQAFVMGPGFGIQYEWNPGALTGSNQVVSPATTTTYVVSALNPQSTCTGYDTLTITVNPSNNAAFTYSYLNQTVTFVNGSTGGTSWFWDFGDGNTSTDENPVHTYPGNNVYTVTLIVSNGLCPPDTLIQLVTVGPAGIQNLEGPGDLVVYPNPASEQVTVLFYSNTSQAEVRVVNELGQTVNSRVQYRGSGNLYDVKIDLRSLAKGVYVIQVITDDSSREMKVVVGK
jgi:PKD repeat protein